MHPALCLQQKCTIFEIVELVLELKMANQVASGSKGPKCCCGVCVDEDVGNSFHRCLICKGRTRAGICFVEESLEGLNGICHACAKVRDDGNAKVRDNEKKAAHFRGEVIRCAHPTDSQ